MTEVDALQAIQNRLSEISALKYVDEDWGQLDYYSPNHPVQWPCALIDLGAVAYSNIGMDRTQTPINRQMGTISAVIKVANLKLTNSSKQAPQGQKNNAWFVHELKELIHHKLQGFAPSERSAKMIRVSQQRIQRDDGVQEYDLVYTFTLNDC